MSLSLYIIRHIPRKHRGDGCVREWEDNELFYCNAPTQEWAEVVGNIHDNPKMIKRK